MGVIKNYMNVTDLKKKYRIIKIFSFVLLVFIIIRSSMILPLKIMEGRGIDICVYTGDVNPGEFCEKYHLSDEMEDYLAEYHKKDGYFNDHYLIIITTLISETFINRVYADSLKVGKDMIEIDIKVRKNLIELAEVFPPLGSLYLSSVWEVDGKYNGQTLRVNSPQTGKLYLMENDILYQPPDEGYKYTPIPYKKDVMFVLKYKGSGKVARIPEMVEDYEITGICEFAFPYRSGITEIYLPKSIEFIEDSPFSSISLTGIYADKNSMYLSSVNGVLFNKDHTELIQYPCAMDSETYVVPDTVETITYYAFYQNQFLRQITIPASVTTMPRSTVIIDTGDNAYLKLIVAEDSEAERYAEENGYAYEYIEEPEE